MTHGVLVLDKAAGPSSHDMVVELRRILATPKIGHIGTLDPFATGVLPLCVGKATRLARYLGEGDKVYEAELRFGFATDTGDWTGQPLSAAVAVHVDPELLAAELRKWHGTVTQVPPRFSAQKLKGVPMYRYARKGILVEPTPRQVTIHEMALLGLEQQRCRLRIRCSPGTYIRSIAADLGSALGCGAHLAALRRTAAGEFDLEQAVGVEWFGQDLDPARLRERIIPLEQLLKRLPQRVLTAEGMRRVQHGAALLASHFEETGGGIAWPSPPPIRLFSPEGMLVAIGEADAESFLLRPVVVLT